MEKPRLLGKIVRDKSTGLLGRATRYSISEYGEENYFVEPKWNGNEEFMGRVLEAGRLEEVEGEKSEKDYTLSEKNRGEIFRK